LITDEKRDWVDAIEWRTHIDTLMREARRHSRAFFFSFEEEDRELFDSRHRDIAPIISSKEGLSEVSRVLKE